MLPEANKPRIAVLLAAYNGTAFIEEQVHSILCQQDVTVQIFVSIDHSKDGTEALMECWAGVEPRLTLLPMGQRFGGAAPNFYRLIRDVNFADFDYVAFADQDDVWRPEKFSRAHSAMKKNDAQAYSSNFTAFWASGQSRLVNKAYPQRQWDFMFESAGPGCTYVFDVALATAFKEMLARTDEQLTDIDYHDWLIYAFARFHGFKWVIDEWSSMNYRQHANNQVGVNVGWRSFWNRARKILNGYGFAQSLLIAETIDAGSLPVVRWGLSGGRIGCLRLALSAARCRRNPKDQCMFFASCLLLAFASPLKTVPK
jgi:rhamnosyltransferase